jgi:hypothetical protein
MLDEPLYVVLQPLNELLRVAIDITRPAATDKFLPPRFAMPREG